MTYSMLSRRAMMGSAAAAACSVTACRIEEVVPANRRVGALIDMSGSYAANRDVVASELIEITRSLNAGDQFFVQYITACSYSDEYAPHDLRWALSPSKLNALTEIAAVQRFLEQEFALPLLTGPEINYTDIRGALHLAADMQRASGLATGVWFVFSDLKITIQQDCATATQGLSDLSNISVVGVNIARDAADMRSRADYRANIARFAAEIEAASGQFEEAQSVRMVANQVLPAAA